MFGAGGTTGGSANKSGFSFPILDDPASVFSLLMGSDVSLVEFDSGPLTLGFTWRQAFGPVYAPPPVMVTLSGSASVTLRFMAGLDTAGIRYAVEAAQAGAPVDGLKLLDGLYFKTTDNDGTPVPVVRLDGEIAAGAAVTALIITVGIEGGLHLTIGFHWNDPNNDGKFRVSEFLQAAVNNPLCLFTTTGRLESLPPALHHPRASRRSACPSRSRSPTSRCSTSRRNPTASHHHPGWVARRETRSSSSPGTSARTTPAARPGATRPTPRPTSSR